MVYDFLREENAGFRVYADDKYRIARIGTKRPLERWDRCTKMLLVNMTPALHALFLQQNFDQNTEESLRKLVNETIEFALKKFRAEILWGEEIRKDISERLQSIKVVFGYSNELFSPELLEELYGDVDFDQNFIKVSHAITNLVRKLKREQSTRQLLNLRKAGVQKFTYRSTENLLCNYFQDLR